MMTLKIILVVVVLLAMVLLLLGIGHLFSGNFNTNHQEIEGLRRDIKDRDEVITRNNSFHDFLNPTRQGEKNR